MPVRSPLRERHAGALDGDVGPRAHRDSHIRGSQRRSVVDAVARHGHDPALALEPLNHRALLFGQHLGLDLGDGEPPATASAVV